MKGYEIMEFIVRRHLQNAEFQVFSTEKWEWIPVTSLFSHGKEVVSIDAKYLTDEHVKALKKKED